MILFILYLSRFWDVDYMSLCFSMRNTPNGWDFNQELGWTLMSYAVWVFMKWLHWFLVDWGTHWKMESTLHYAHDVMCFFLFGVYLHQQKIITFISSHIICLKFSLACKNSYSSIEIKIHFNFKSFHYVSNLYLILPKVSFKALNTIRFVNSESKENRNKCIFSAPTYRHYKGSEEIEEEQKRKKDSGHFERWKEHHNQILQ